MGERIRVLSTYLTIEADKTVSHSQLDPVMCSIIHNVEKLV